MMYFIQLALTSYDDELVADAEWLLDNLPDTYNVNDVSAEWASAYVSLFVRTIAKPHLSLGSQDHEHSTNE